MSSIAIAVQYYGLIREVVPVGEETERVPMGTTVRALLAAVGARYGDRFGEALFAPNGQPVPNAILALDGHSVFNRGGLDTPLERDGTFRILLMPPFTGGG